jgi:hypothetical protein
VYRPACLLDGASRDVDDGPVLTLEQAARGDDLLTHRVRVDIVALAVLLQ